MIGTRSFGTDPARVAAHVAAWVAGLQEAGVAACAKHFPGHGDTAQDSHLALPTVDADLATLARPRAGAVRGGGRGRDRLGDDLAHRRPRPRPGLPGDPERPGAAGCCATGSASTA